MKSLNAMICFSCLFLSFACAQPKQVVTAPVAVQKDDTEINFRFESSDLLPKNLSKLDSDIQFLKNNPSTAVVIEGHTDTLGENEYNLDLGDLRAKAVKAYFIKNGIEGDRIVTITYGKDKPKEQFTSTREFRRVVIRDMKK